MSLEQGKVVAYRLVPVREAKPGSIVTAACIHCMATGKLLSGSGGGGEYLSPEVVAMLRGGGCTIIKDDGQ